MPTSTPKNSLVRFNIATQENAEYLVGLLVNLHQRDRVIEDDPQNDPWRR